MTQNAINAAAEALVQARKSRRALERMDAAHAPRTPEEGYAVQSRFRELWSDHVAGWKVGATARPIMQRFGLGEPLFGPFYAGDVFKSPARIKASRFNHLCLETEMSFRIGVDLPVRSGGYARSEIVAAVDAVRPSFELIDPRFKAIPFDRVSEAIADCGLNGGMVFGPAFSSWQDVDLINHKARLVVDGATKGEGTGALALDDPVNVLEWCVNALGRRGIPLLAGQHIATGTLTGVVYVEAGQTAIGDFGSLGQVEVRFEA